MSEGSLRAALRRRRIELGWTQQELAVQSGLSVRAVGKIEQGWVGNARPASIRRLVQALGLDPCIVLSSNAVPSPGIRVGILGPVVVRVNDQKLELGAEKQRILLGLFALQRGATVTRDEIVEVLWGQRPPATWRNLVHTYVTRLRKALATFDGESVIVTTPGGYRLPLSSQQLDVVQFHTLIEPDGDIAPAADQLATALDLWRGPLLADLPDELRRHPDAIALRERRIITALNYADAGIGGESVQRDTVVKRLRALITEEPLHEGLQARLILSLAASGRQAEAITQFLNVRNLLDTELGVNPGAELQRIYSRVLRQELAD